MITASNVTLDEEMIVADVGFEDVLKAVLPKEVYTDEEGEELEKRFPSESLVERGSPSDIPSRVLDEGLRNESPVESASPGGLPSENVDEKISAERAIQKFSVVKDSEKESSGAVPETRLRRSCRTQAKTTMVAEESTGSRTDNLPCVVQMLHQSDAGEPESNSKAASDARSQEVMRSEYDWLTEHEMFYHATDDHLRPITCKWVFRLKTNADGSLRYKARLVARGFEQVHCMDYSETFVPIARLTTFRIYIALALELQATIHHLDVVTPFLNPVIEERTAISIPQEIEWLDPELAQELTPSLKLRLN